IGYITVPYENTLQTRVTRDGQSYSKAFTITQHAGSLAETYRAARQYLDGLAATLPRKPSRLRRSPTPTKTSNLPVGVSIGTTYDKRRDAGYLVVQVHWHDGLRVRNKSFHIGREDVVDPRDCLPVVEVAIEFRRAYE